MSQSFTMKVEYEHDFGGLFQSGRATILEVEYAKTVQEAHRRVVEYLKETIEDFDEGLILCLAPVEIEAVTTKIV